MSAPDISLLARRRFAPMFVVQFLGAFNDNLLKFALLFLASFGIFAGQPEKGELLATISTGLFILPYFLFSALAGQLADLETRALAALENGDEAMALEAAGMIAELEAEADCSTAAQARFGAEVTRLRKALREAEARLRALQRGERLSVAVDRSQKMREVLSEGGEAPLDAAETTLARLTERQEQADLMAGAMAELKAETRVEGLRTKLAEAGHGPALKPSAETVLERLKQKRAAA